jgi:hypothetical protein
MKKKSISLFNIVLRQKNKEEEKKKVEKFINKTYKSPDWSFSSFHFIIDFSRLTNFSTYLLYVFDTFLSLRCSFLFIWKKKILFSFFLKEKKLRQCVFFFFSAPPRTTTVHIFNVMYKGLLIICVSNITQFLLV